MSFKNNRPRHLRLLPKAPKQLHPSSLPADLLASYLTTLNLKSLDSRTMGQNALEIVKIIETIFDKAKEKEEALARGEKFDPELKNAESDFEQWIARKEK